ncbi:unnamed protein product [Schistosoma turkestanicum]|nr:unnamed protein product [Schistosoma turkestanicum]
MKSLYILCLLVSLILYVNSVIEDSMRQLQHHKDHRPGSQPNLYQCIACRTSVRQVRNIFLSSSTKKSVKGIIANLCAGTGPFNTSCTMFASELASNIFYTISRVIPQHICAVFDFCFNPPKISVCEYCLRSGLLVKSILLSNTIVSELYNNTVTMCNTQLNHSIICAPFLHDLFLAVTLSFNKEFIMQRFCQNAGFCLKP